MEKEKKTNNQNKKSEGKKKNVKKTTTEKSEPKKSNTKKVNKTKSTKKVTNNTKNKKTIEKKKPVARKKVHEPLEDTDLRIKKAHELHEEAIFNIWIDVLILVFVLIMFAVILYGYIVSA